MIRNTREDAHISSANPKTAVPKTLFDPFVTAGKSNGTGLELTLARRIAEADGGSVRFEELNRERRVFTLSLPKNRLIDSVIVYALGSWLGDAQQDIVIARFHD